MNHSTDEGSVASAFASGSSALEFIRLPECEITAANEPDGYSQRRGKCSARRMIRQFYMTGTTTWKQNTITDERALARFFDPQVIFQVRKRLHIHRSWRTTTRTGTSEPTQQTQVTELSITSWNPDTLNHGKLDRFLIYFDADITRLRTRTTPKEEKAKDDTITPVRSEWSVGAGQIAQRYDPPRSLAGRIGGIRGEKLASTQRSHNFGRVRTTGKWTFGAQKHFWDHVKKTMAKLPRRT